MWFNYKSKGALLLNRNWLTLSKFDICPSVLILSILYEFHKILVMKTRVRARSDKQPTAQTRILSLVLVLSILYELKKIVRGTLELYWENENVTVRRLTWCPHCLRRGIKTRNVIHLLHIFILDWIVSILVLQRLRRPT